MTPEQSTDKPGESIFYFPKWAWQRACHREPDKYKLFEPTYKGCRVILT